MSIGRFLFGAASLFVLLGSLAWGARRLRACWLPEWSGATAVLAEIVLLWTGLFGVSQLLGALGLFRPVTLVVACALAGLVSGVLSGKVRTAAAVTATSRLANSRSLIEVLVAAGAVAVAVASWAVASARAFPIGIKAFDSIQYHLPRAARFAQEGWLTHLHFTGPEFPDTFHPMNSEVAHAVGMMLLGNDFLSPFLNLVWLGCFLLAGWCVGASTRREPLTLAMSALLAAIPGYVSDQAGTAANDVAAAFLVAACAALLLQVPSRRAAISLAALSGGMALSTKLTVLAAVVALTLGVIVVFARTHGRRVIWMWGLPLTCTGGFWYARNLLATGSPVPSLRLGIGPLRLPYGGFALVDVLGYRVTHYASDVDVWRSWFVPALARFFGPAWWAVAALALGGVAASIVAGRSSTVRMLGTVAAFAGVAYTVTPTSALGPDGQPFLFEGNLVYTVPAVALALLLVPLPLSVERRAARSSFFVVVVATLLVAQFSERSPWRGGRIGIGVLSVLIVAAAAALWVVVLPLSRRVVASTGLGVMLCVLAAGAVAATTYAQRRYEDDQLASWAASVGGARIAEAGVVDQYRLYDPALRNRVEFVGDRGSHGSIHPARSCVQWRTALRRGRFNYVVLRTGDFSTSSPADDTEVRLGLSSVGERELLWTRSDPAASEVLSVGRVIVFTLDARIRDPGCRTEDD